MMAGGRYLWKWGDKGKYLRKYEFNGKADALK